MGVLELNALKERQNELKRIFLLRCIERYLHAAQSCYLEGANELARLYFSPARSEASGRAVIESIDQTAKKSLQEINEGPMYAHLHRFTSCAKEGMSNHHDIEQKFWHAIDDLVEADLMMGAVIPQKRENPSDLISRVKKEYDTLAPLNNGVCEPEHRRRYRRSGVRI